MLEKLEKLTSLTGITSVLGSWQVCHNACLGLIAILSIIGITLTGMPLEFFTRIALPFWIAALLLLSFSIFMHVKRQCITRNSLLFNSGLVLAGTPGSSRIPFIIGLGIVAVSGAIYTHKKVKT